MKRATLVPVVVAGIFAFCSVTAGLARADVDGASVAGTEASEGGPETITRTESYRGWILASDFASLTLATAVGPGGALAYVLGPPAIHLAHGNPHALTSFALRLGLPLAGLMISSRHSDSRCADAHGYCGVAEPMMGLVIGVAAASAIDIAFLAETDVEVENPAPWMLQTGSVNANPVVASTPGGGLSLGLNGTF